QSKLMLSCGLPPIGSKKASTELFLFQRFCESNSFSPPNLSFVASPFGHFFSSLLFSHFYSFFPPHIIPLFRNWRVCVCVPTHFDYFKTTKMAPTAIDGPGQDIDEFTHAHAERLDARDPLRHF